MQHWFCIITIRKVNRVERQITYYYYCKNRFDLADPLTWYMYPPRYAQYILRTSSLSKSQQIHSSYCWLVQFQPRRYEENILGNSGKVLLTLKRGLQTQRDICTPMFRAALFAIAKRWKKNPNVHQWMNW